MTELVVWNQWYTQVLLFFPPSCIHMSKQGVSAFAEESSAAFALVHGR